MNKTAMYGGSDVRPKKFSLLPKNINSEQKKIYYEKRSTLVTKKIKFVLKKLNIVLKRFKNKLINKLSCAQTLHTKARSNVKIFHFKDDVYYQVC